MNRMSMDLTRLGTGIAGAISRACQLTWFALREIFDESAYQRFLVRTQQPSSRGAFAAFTAERSQTQARRPRCC